MTLKKKLHEIIFEAETPEGKAFDIVLIILIISSVICVIIDSVEPISTNYKTYLYILEWFFTIVFTIEYFLRLWIIEKPLKYAKSFYGIIDFLSFVPSYLSLLFTGTHYLIVLRTLRLLRIFRLFKLIQYVKESNIILIALKESRYKVFVFLFAILNIVIVIGTLMYVIEGEQNGFTSIPKGIYWAIVTITTVGYGDISPKTPLGQFLSSAIMILGYAIIAVPTGIVTHELSKAYNKKSVSTENCPSCGRDGHDTDALYCKYCGAKLNE
ncbi:potassium channel protein [Deferribacter desulfuricans SSM1]|uniref:Potassium channel protein n=1 Tax=Deferribacter desulfuricans (strain DSM 14783 / JCM 11476 / NBRC 101012 / SSM1) TaxID=639282 RepID=D3PE78_DEFDS|nr:ion transporter [Deferribacter desulfuricans]BAI80901.1 potassium channel protein [Deferribacter desulfuricans SSM1]